MFALALFRHERIIMARATQLLQCISVYQMGGNTFIKRVEQETDRDHDFYVKVTHLTNPNPNMCGNTSMLYVITMLFWFLSGISRQSTYEEDGVDGWMYQTIPGLWPRWPLSVSCVELKANIDLFICWLLNFPTQLNLRDKHTYFNLNHDLQNNGQNYETKPQL